MISTDWGGYRDIAKLTLDAKRASRVGSTALEEAVRPFELLCVNFSGFYGRSEIENVLTL